MQRVLWNSPQPVGPLSYKCGYCGDRVGGYMGWFGAISEATTAQGRIYICTTCSAPTYFEVYVTPGSTDATVSLQVPPPAYGEDLEHLPLDAKAAYEEARASFGVGAYGATVMMCRKLLMHVAVDVARVPPGQGFSAYIDVLLSGGFIAAPHRPWVEKIRSIGNDANHELAAINKEQAQMVLDFVAMLLKTLYEYTARASGPRPSTSSSAKRP